MSSPIRVLLIDDDQDDYVLTRDLFADIPGDRYRLDWVAEYAAALDAVCRNQHDLRINRDVVANQRVGGTRVDSGTVLLPRQIGDSADVGLIDCRKMVTFLNAGPRSRTIRLDAVRNQFPVLLIPGNAVVRNLKRLFFLEVNPSQGDRGSGQ